MHPINYHFPSAAPESLPAPTARETSACHRQTCPSLFSRAFVWLLAWLGIVVGSLTTVRAQEQIFYYDFSRFESGNTVPVLGRDGNLYLTHLQGGRSANLLGQGGSGTVSRISPKTTGLPVQVFQEETLADFGNGADGGAPNGIVEGSDGNFYGTTSFGGSFGIHEEGGVHTFGAYGGGTIFRVTSGGKPTILYRFTGKEDGGQSRASLIQGADGSFYGTTQKGGTEDHGTVFRFTPDGDSGVLTTLYRFSGEADGSGPTDKLAQGADGNLYGAAAGGGPDKQGTIFRITPTGEFTLLHSFNLGEDSGTPFTPTQGLDGSFYGTAGAPHSKGSVYRITPAGEFTTIHAFTGNKPDGADPSSSLVLGSDGNFYGSAGNSLIQITPEGAVQTFGSFTRSTATGEYDGGDGPSDLTPGPGGLFYGVTQTGGSNDNGTLFTVKAPVGPDAPAQVSFHADATTIHRGTGGVATVTFTRLGGNLANNLRIPYEVRGAAVAGQDYAALSRVAKIKRGKTAATVTITALPGGSDGKVKLVLPAADAYQVQGASTLKVKIME